MDKINEQLIRIETKLETLLIMAKARNASKEKQQDKAGDIFDKNIDKLIKSDKTT